MAILPAAQLSELRQGISVELTNIGFSKSDVNAALQAIEDWFDKPAVQSSLSDDIDAGTTYSFSNLEKKKLAKFWMSNRWRRE